MNLPAGEGKGKDSKPRSGSLGAEGGACSRRQ